MLLEREALRIACAALRADDFYVQANGLLFGVMARLNAAGESVDRIIVAGLLEDQGALEELGGESFLLRLEEAPPTAAMIGPYVARVKGLAVARRQRAAAQRFVATPLEPEPRVALIEAMAEEEQTVKAIPWAEVADTSPDVPWGVRGLIFRGGQTILSGPGGTAKSYLALTLGHAVATGSHWLGEFEVESQGPVVYVDAERGRLLMGQRLRELERSAGRPAHVHFVFRPPTLDLGFLRSLAREYEPALMILDSLSRLLPDEADENSNTAMTAALDPVRRVAEELSTSMLVLHHDRKPQPFADNRGAVRVRGASAIVNVADIVLLASRDPEERVLVQTAKTWFGDTIPPFACRFNTDPETGIVSLLFDGYIESPGGGELLAAARVTIVETVEQAGQLLERPAILEACRRAGHSERTSLRALAELREAGILRHDGYREGRKLFRLDPGALAEEA